MGRRYGTGEESGISTYAEPTVLEWHPMPDFVTAALDQNNLWERYYARPSISRMIMQDGLHVASERKPAKSGLPKCLKNCRE